MAIALPLIAIYLYTKFYLNANSSFKSYLPDKVPDRRTDKAATICNIYVIILEYDAGVAKGA